MWLCAAVCTLVTWQFVAVTLAVAGVVGEAGWAAAADAAVAECTARARDAAAETTYRATWASQGFTALGRVGAAGSRLAGGLAVSDTAAAVGAASGARVWGGEVGEAASLILLELEVGSLLKLATHPRRLRPGSPGSWLRYALGTSR